MSINSQIATRKYPQYPACRPSGIDWLGDIPEEWEVKRLKYVANSNTQSLAETTPEDFEFRYLDIGNVGMGYIISEPIEMAFRNAPSRARRVVNKDDTIISTVRTYLKAIYHFEVDPKNVVVSTGFAVIKPREGIHPKYFYYLSLSENFIDSIVSNSFGVSYPAINASLLLTLPVWYPSWREQQGIVEFLDRKTALIDDVIAKKQKLIELLKEKRQALITQAVTKGLDPNAKLKPSGIEWLGDIPEGWEVKRLKRLGRPIIGLTYSPEDVTMADHGTLVLRASNVQAGRIVYEDNVYVSVNIPKELQTRVGDILICSRSGSANLIGKNAIIDNQSAGMTFGAFMTIFRSAHNAFLYFFFNSPLFESQSGLYATTTINQLTTSMLSNFMLAVPPVREQGRIVDFLIRETSQIDSVVTKIIDQIDKLHEYRLALITSAVTGNIDVRGQ